MGEQVSNRVGSSIVSSGYFVLYRYYTYIPMERARQVRYPGVDVSVMRVEIIRRASAVPRFSNYMLLLE